MIEPPKKDSGQYPPVTVDLRDPDFWQSGFVGKYCRLLKSVIIIFPRKKIKHIKNHKKETLNGAHSDSRPTIEGLLSLIFWHRWHRSLRFSWQFELAQRLKEIMENIGQENCFLLNLHWCTSVPHIYIYNYICMYVCMYVMYVCNVCMYVCM